MTTTNTEKVGIVFIITGLFLVIIAAVLLFINKTTNRGLLWGLLIVGFVFLVLGIILKAIANKK